MVSPGIDGPDRFSLDPTHPPLKSEPIARGCAYLRVSSVTLNKPMFVFDATAAATSLLVQQRSDPL